MMDRRHFLGGAAGLGLIGLAAPARAGNPILPGWYADPEIHIFEGRYWVYPTLSADGTGPLPENRFSATQEKQRAQPGIWAPFLHQTRLDAFSSPDLVNWTRHPAILDDELVAWAAYAMWAPSVLHHRGRYYLFFGANDIRDDSQPGGIGVAVADRPGGPFHDAIGAPLIGSVVNGSQPIDQMAFRDVDGEVYLYYGGWKHCNVVRLTPELTALRPFADGTRFKPITPAPDYVEGPYMLERRGTYYFMWSEGEWTGPDYRVAYATGPTALGPFTPRGLILAQDGRVARGAGHNSVINIPGTDDWYIAYHRRPLETTDGNHRQLALDRMHFREDGSIAPVVITREGVGARPLRR